MKDMNDGPVQDSNPQLSLTRQMLLQLSYWDWLNARVMYTRNLDVASGLVSGAFGTMLGFQHGSCSDELSTMYVHFDNNDVP